MNANPLELMARYAPEKWVSVLREIERHQRALEAQRTRAQATWSEEAARRSYVSTGRAAEMIVSSH